MEENNKSFLGDDPSKSSKKKLADFFIGTAIAFTIFFIIPEIFGIYNIFLIYLIVLPIITLIYLKAPREKGRENILKYPDFMTWTFVMMGVMLFIFLIIGFIS